MMSDSSPFQLPDHPKSALQLLIWLLKEPVLFKNFGDRLKRKQILVWLLRSYGWVCLFTGVLYLLGMCLFAYWELPTHFPGIFTDSLLGQWKHSHSLLEKLVLLVEFNFSGLAFGLAVGLAIGLTLGLAVGLAIGLAFGLDFGLAVGLAVGLAFDLVVGLVVGLDFGLVGGLALGLAFGLAFGLGVGLDFGLDFGSDFDLAVGLAVSLAVSLAFGLVVGLVVGLVGDWVEGVGAGIGFSVGFIPVFYFFYFRLFYYPFHLFSNLLRIDLQHNPHLYNGAIWFPLWGIDRRLCLQSEEDPQTGQQFSEFLLQYRPLQRQLALQIFHHSLAGFWSASPLVLTEFYVPNIPESETKFCPSAQWHRQHQAVYDTLNTAQKHNHIGLKREAFEEFVNALEKFRQMTLQESDAWKAPYLRAIDRWQEIAAEQRQQLEEAQQLAEPIQRNLYRSGESLRPQDFGQETFLGRDDLKDDLSRLILSSPQMPTILLQGQRRVGKTSLLNFLPHLLGPRFTIVYQDMQSHVCGSLADWLTDLRRQMEKALHLPVSQWQATDDLLASWKELQTFLETISLNSDQKVILAMDEYEEWHRLLHQAGETGERLLGQMRSFSQHQNQIVFLFAGLKLFSDTEAPDLSYYWVHAHRVSVDYLNPQAALQLIVNPYPDFQLQYPPELAQSIVEATAGHPALLQKIGYTMVNLANRQNFRAVTESHWHQVLEEVLVRDNFVIINFWKHFCQDKADQQTVWEILAGNPPTNDTRLARLLEYKFIEQWEGGFRLRVPLFAEWVRKYGKYV